MKLNWTPETRYVQEKKVTNENTCQSQHFVRRGIKKESLLHRQYRIKRAFHNKVCLAALRKSFYSLYSLIFRIRHLNILKYTRYMVQTK
jgi:hypothetical protein